MIDNYCDELGIIDGRKPFDKKIEYESAYYLSSKLDGM